jgi:hypothetical protein
VACAFAFDPRIWRHDPARNGCRRHSNPILGPQDGHCRGHALQALGRNAPHRQAPVRDRSAEHGANDLRPFESALLQVSAGGAVIAVQVGAVAGLVSYWRRSCRGQIRLSRPSARAGRAVGVVTACRGGRRGRDRAVGACCLCLTRQSGSEPTARPWRGSPNMVTWRRARGCCGHWVRTAAIASCSARVTHKPEALSPRLDGRRRRSGTSWSVRAS